MGDLSRVLIIGLDSADPDLILTWADEGLLPTFASLRETAAWGFIGNSPGTEAGGVWPTFYTGVSPARHGQYDDLKYFDAATYDYAYYRPDELIFDPIWTRVSKAGGRVAVLDAPYTHLAENLNGVHLKDWGTHLKGTSGVGEFRSWPRHLAAEVQSRFGRDPFGTSCCDSLQPRKREFNAFRELLLDRIQRKEAISADLLAQETWDFFLTVFADCHCVGHQCWHLHDPSHPRHDPALVRAVGNPMKDVYVAIDAAVGRLLDHADDDTMVLVYCSHGTGPFYSGSFLLDQILTRLEGIAPPAKREWALETLRGWWRQAPRALRDSLMPLRKLLWESRYPKSVQSAISKRKYFEVANNNATGGVRINLVGREAHGRVQPGAEYDALCDQLTADLLDVVNQDSGQPLVERILRTADVYEGENLDKLPDLLVDWNRDMPIRQVHSPKIGTVENRYQTWRTGDHTNVGLFFGLGPSVTAGPLADRVSATDFAPTIAALLGVPLPGIDGQAIAALTGALQPAKV